MALRPKYLRLTRVAVPARAAAQRFAFLLLAGAAMALLILGKTHSDEISEFRIAVIDRMAPVLEFASRPVEAVEAGIASARRLVNTYAENDQLRRDRDRLLNWQAIARKLEQENAQLRAQLNVTRTPSPVFVSALVIGDTGGPFVKTRLVNAGRADGVLKGQAAMASTGLAGRIVEVGEQASRLLLLTDLNSRVPVMVESSRYRAVLAGDNSANPRLIFLPANAKVAPGDRIVTSGHGGVFPPGLPVGAVSSVADSEVRIQPFADWERMEYVTVLRYRLPTLERLEAASPRAQSVP